MTKKKPKKKSKSSFRTSQTTKTPPSNSNIYNLKKQHSEIGIVWDAPFLNFTGYAEEARAYVARLQQLNFYISARNVGRISPSFVEQINDNPLDIKIGLKNSLGVPFPPTPISIVNLPASQIKRVLGSEYSIARTMFETNSLPPDWIDPINNMDEIWVPTTFSEQSFRRAGITSPIYIVPEGVDTKLFCPGLPPLPIPGLANKVFLSIFEWSFRKGWDILLSAWAKAFSSQDDVCLIIRSSIRTSSDLGKEEIETKINDYLKNQGFDITKIAPIIVLSKEITIKDMPRLLATADVYVSPTRGEGVGRPQMESMSCGIPVITTRWSGMLDFMDDSNSYLIDIEGLEEIDDRMELEHFRGQLWAKPSEAHLIELLYKVINHPKEAQQKATKARNDIIQNWTWEKAVLKITERLEEIIPKVISTKAARETSIALQHKTLSVGWQGDIFSNHSLSLVNREILSRITSSPYIRFISSFSESKPYPVEFQEMLKNLNWTPESAKGPIDIEIRHQWPPDFSTSLAKVKILMQPWEFGGIPSGWIDSLKDELDELWCPSSWVKQCYIDSGISESKIQVIPLGVDTKIFTPKGPKFKLKTQKKFKFLFLGGTIYRKGIDLLIETYLDTFRSSDDVCLVVKSFGANSVYAGSAMDRWIANLSKDPFLPEIELIEEELDQFDLASLYRSCDILAHPYRGEGFGLPIAEAMATAKPTIVTNYGGCLDFCDSSTSYLIPATLQNANLENFGPSPIGYWLAQPDQEALSQALLFAVKNPEVGHNLGKKAKQKIEADFSWDKTSQLVLDRLNFFSNKIKNS